MFYSKAMSKSFMVSYNEFVNNHSGLLLVRILLQVIIGLHDVYEPLIPLLSFPSKIIRREYTILSQLTKHDHIYFKISP